MALLDGNDQGTPLYGGPGGGQATYGGGYTQEPSFWERLRGMAPTREGVRRFLTSPVDPRTLATVAAQSLPGASLADLPQASGELQDAAKRGDLLGVGTAGLKGANSLLGAVPVVGAIDRGLLAAGKEAQAAVRGERVAANLPQQVEGTLGKVGKDAAQPVVFRGKEPHQFGPQDWGDFGRQYGVDTLGPKDETQWRASLAPVKTQSGREVTIPGGLDSKEPFTYYDLLHMKAQGIDPNDLLPHEHQAIHDRMVGAMQPGPGGPSNEQLLNQTMFGMISPNQPLTPNELALQRVMVKGPQDVDTLAGMVPHYTAGDIPVKERQELSRGMTTQLGLQAAEKGGLGASGSADYSNIAQAAQKFKDQPGFFRFNPDDNTLGGMSDSEKWATHVTRLFNEIRGLKAKTGSLASVWQSPQTAQISAIDRHMATKFRTDMFSDPAEANKWGEQTVASWNTARPDQTVGTVDELLNTSGGRGHFVDQALNYVNRTKGAVTRTRTGEFNPRVPEAIRNTNWIGGEPKQVELIGDPMKRALEANAAEAQKTGQSLFSNQWMLWDRIRGRLEPHEILYPGLEKLPRMSLDQMKEVQKAHSQAGYLAAEGKVRPVPNASRVGYFSVPPLLAGAAVGGGLLGSEDESTAR